MANETKGLNLPYHTDGGRHPSGAILSYRFYHQANGSTRIDCINDGYMVFSKGGLDEHQARGEAEVYMRIGNQFDRAVKAWVRADDEVEGP
jgi:hypothetical protein